MCRTGIGTGGATVGAAAPDHAAAVVLKNNVVASRVYANKRHWYKAAEVLTRADGSWLARLITRREPPQEFTRALRRQREDIKVIVQFGEHYCVEQVCGHSIGAG